MGRIRGRAGPGLGSVRLCVGNGITGDTGTHKCSLTQPSSRSLALALASCSRLSSPSSSFPRVSDRTASYLSDGVGGAAIADLSGTGAPGGDGSDDLGGVGHVAPGVGASGSGKDGGSRELHFG